MPLRRIVLGLAVGLLCLPSAARAILIETGGARVGGYLVRDDGKKLSIRVPTAGGKDKVTEYDRAKVKLRIVHQIDVKRLEGLSKDNPKAYREYAEDLAEQKGDPEARDMAMRLYLIAAYLDRPNLGRKCLLSMSTLAATPAEARRLKALAFLLDPDEDPALLKVDPVKPAQLPKSEAAALQLFLKALHYYRVGQTKFAKEVAAREGVGKIFSMAPGMIDHQTFIQRCNDATCSTCGSKGVVRCATCGGTGVSRNMFGQPQRCTMCNGNKVLTCTACDGTGANQAIPEDVIRIILRAELWGLDQLTGGAAAGTSTPASAETAWSVLLRERQVEPVAPLTLETISEFDPRKCLYRNGAWVAP